jgi:putative adenylate-forming enzyme
VSVFTLAAAYASARWRARTLHGDSLRAWQDVRAQRLIATVRERSPYYRELWRGYSAAQWAGLPRTNKAAMMDNFDSFNTRGVSGDLAMRVALDAEHSRDFSATLDGCTVGLSSGTSGHRGLFLVSPDEQTRWAGTILARAIPELRPGLRVAFFLRANSRLYERTSSIVQFQFFDLMQPLAAVIASLNALRPQVIVGPPSLLGLLADARIAGALHASPSRLISVAEVLEPQDRLRLESTFNAPVGEVYQCTEGLIAVSCSAGTLHVQEDVMVVQTNPIAHDDAGRVTPVLTDLWRVTQPIVRYELGDVLRLGDGPCACGSPWQQIVSVEGRQDDLCHFPMADGTLRMVFPDAIRRMVLLADSGIAEYRAEQEYPGQLHVMLDIAHGHTFAVVAPRVSAMIRRSLGEYACRVETLEVSVGVPLGLPGHKRRRVINLSRTAASMDTAAHT